ncbi:MAG TPA: Ig domain-containing protein, partial [Armatimonadota bacterium]|nr:Ig domain-containing protein [Armatimonadota bacterium]
IDTNSHASPFTGMFSPDHSYYWSVRACNEAGLWGDWAPTQVFRWDGPMPPVDLALDERDDGLWLTWNRSARGPLLVRYEVHASNRRGFRPSKEPYQVHTLGEVPATFVAATDHSEMRVVSPTGDAPNSSAYRVVAIDMFGTPSGPSWALEIPCPRIYSQPILQAEAGRPHTCTVKTLRCDGDLQYRYQKPGYAYWEREGYEFSLAEGPPWLSIDAATGVLSGTPPQPGQFPVRVVAKRTWPDEVKADQYRPEYFAKDAPEFQAEDEQTFTLTVVERAP